MSNAVASMPMPTDPRVVDRGAYIGELFADSARLSLKFKDGLAKYMRGEEFPNVLLAAAIAHAKLEVETGIDETQDNALPAALLLSWNRLMTQVRHDTRTRSDALADADPSKGWSR